jgi:hypothetical protein
MAMCKNTGGGGPFSTDHGEDIPEPKYRSFDAQDVFIEILLDCWV